MLRGQVSLTFTKEGTEGHSQATEGWDCWQTLGVRCPGTRAWALPARCQASGRPPAPRDPGGCWGCAASGPDSESAVSAAARGHDENTRQPSTAVTHSALSPGGPPAAFLLYLFFFFFKDFTYLRERARAE